MDDCGTPNTAYKNWVAIMEDLLLVDIRTVQVGATGDEVSVEFWQALLRLSSEGDVYADDKDVYVADIRWQDDTRSWVIKQFRERIS